MARERPMQARIGKLGVALAALLLVSACAEGDPKLMNLRSSGSGPDEFAILPTKPLQAPPNFTTLPVPTPGGTNLTDPTPAADAIAALGGNPAVVSRASGGADAGLLAHASRYGKTEEIRGLLAAEDLSFRRENNGRLLERLFNVNVYMRAYARMSLDQHAEIERWRLLGVRTVGAPPDPALIAN
jgi:hypothetical protein